MQRVRRSRMTDSDKAAIWERWKRGESLSEIGRAINRIPGAVFHVVRARGGIPPAPRCRSQRALTAGDREEISRGLAAGVSFSQIGLRLGRPTSTVSREVGRHGGRRWYRAAVADADTWNRALRPQLCRLAQYPALRARVAEMLEADWSPQQIAGWLKRTYPKDPDMQVSHETIYLSLFVQSRGVLKQALIRHLRRRKTMRRSQHATTAGQTRGQIIDAVSIRERPASVEDRAVPGHWEGDLLAGKSNSHIATLVERQSRFVMLVRLPGKDTDSVVRALTRRVRALPQGLMSSLTWDRGMELAAHKTFTVATDVRVYFCDPQSPWQRGSNENTNGLLRQYFPEGTDLSTYTQANLNAVARRLNMRPRKTLDYKTPADTLAACVASTP
ncbi:MAG TPA: IS30 family transposase [Vicinamibacterales bacterium]|nr:IS30 family transposase [Vicinamibacterales bacterium]